MNRMFHKVDSILNGWLTTIILILLEIFIVYVLSNIPFLLTTLDTPIVLGEKTGFLGKFHNVLQDEISKGQLLTFVCALIAPVVFWSFIEFKKAVQSKILSLLALLLLVLSAYLHGKGEDFRYVESIGLYWAAIVIWVLSILSNNIPPKNKAYSEITNSETASFVEKAKGLSHE